MVSFGCYFPPAVESFNPSHEFVIICFPPTLFSYWLILREIDLKMTDENEKSENEMSENLFSYPDDGEMGSEDDSTDDEEGMSGLSLRDRLRPSGLRPGLACSSPFSFGNFIFSRIRNGVRSVT